MKNKLTITIRCHLISYGEIFKSIDVKKRFLRFFIIFIKNAFFYIFYFWNVFLYSSGEIFYPTKLTKILLNLLNSCIKRLLIDGFNMAAIKDFSHEEP